MVPRDRSLASVLGEYARRLRRLEINHHFPPGGTALYTLTPSGSAADTWAPDFGDAVAAETDQIGLETDGGGLLVPPGWLVAAIVQFTIEAATAPPTGEAVLWSLSSGGSIVVEHADVMTNSVSGAQVLGATIPCATGWSEDGLPIQLGTVSTYLGTEFTPTFMQISVEGIQIPVDGWPSGII
jgi:hypothetical protein